MTRVAVVLGFVVVVAAAGCEKSQSFVRRSKPDLNPRNKWSRVTSDAGLVLVLELDERLGLESFGI